MKAAAARALARIRRVALAFPETSERLSHGAPTFFIRAKKSFAMFVDFHHGDERTVLWFAAPPGAQEAHIARAPERFFRPPYVGHRGWTAAVLDGKVDWRELADLLEEAYCLIAPPKLVAQLPPRD